jgi:putative NADPH-quinone reductase
MPKRILILQAHPDPAGGHLLHAMADAYASGAAAAGHDLRRIDIARLDIPFLHTQAEFEHGRVPASLEPAVQDILWAEHIIFLFPLWLGTMPALLKAFLEQVMRPHVAFAYSDRGLPKKLLAGRSARIVMTMGMPVLAYRWFFGAHGLKGLERSILNFTGIKPVRESLFGMIEAVAPEKRAAWIRDLEALGRSGT